MTDDILEDGHTTSDFEAQEEEQYNDDRALKNNEPLTQAEMFVETRQSTKDKLLDEDTLNVVAHLQAENKNSKELTIRALQSAFG
ncbi:hypothetical protein Ahy_A06g027431 [Arachis hypogaea]|uniref:Uncharacterized protein n=1 Tax=Arachis hypogaea TaxID=3818 RepID=A0A445CNR5_ARAHY|nr:hypothetical protein Ahy_A06g027431 [Arachis hypogaea]